MSHELFDELSSRYRDGDLDPSEIGRFEEHLMNCSRCREAIELDAFIAGSLTEQLDAAYPEALEVRVLDRTGAVPWHSKAATWLKWSW